MNKTIWKYPLEVKDEQVIEIPSGTEFLCVQVQNGQPCLWAKVTPSIPLKATLIITVGTGHAQHTEGMQYVGTYQLYDGSFVGHVFVEQ